MEIDSKRFIRETKFELLRRFDVTEAFAKSRDMVLYEVETIRAQHDSGVTVIPQIEYHKIAEGAVEGHGVKHTHTEELGGPANRVWTANRAWSGTSIVEAGIHQTDIMRYWSNDDVEWVRAIYTDRPAELHETEGDNPIAYTVIYGMKKGGVANLIFTKPARSYYGGRFDCIIHTHGTIKLENDFVDYTFDGVWPPDQTPGIEQVRKIVSPGPHQTAMGQESTRAIGEAFATSIIENKPEYRLNSFNSSINSLASVLAANISNDLGGERIVIDEFINDDKYARYRRNPQK